MSVDHRKGKACPLKKAGLAVLFGALVGMLHGTSTLAQSPIYRYSPYEKPDPFFPAVLLTAPREAVGPLQRQPLSSLVLVGTILGREASALIMGKGEQEETATYVVKVGDKIGSKSGTIISIFADRILVREPLDPSEQTAFRRFQDLALMIRPYDRENPTSGLVDLDGNSKGEKNTVTEALTLDVMPRNASSVPSTSADGSRQSTSSSRASTEAAANIEGPGAWIDQQIRMQNSQRAIDTTSLARPPTSLGDSENQAPDSKETSPAPIMPFGAVPMTKTSGGVSVQQFVPQGLPGYPPLPGQGAP